MVIAGSGGFTGTAKVTQVRVTRDKKGPDGQPVVEEFNMDKIVSATSEKGEVLIYPDDVVVVPRRVF